MCLLAFSVAGRVSAASQEQDGTLEKLIVANGRVTLDLDLQRLGGADSGTARTRTTVRFAVEPNSFMSVLVFNGELRGPLPGSMRLVPQGAAALPGRLGDSSQQLLVEQMSWGGAFDLVVRDATTGFLFFNVEGQQMSYEPSARALRVEAGRLLISKEFAADLGRPSAAGSVAGGISFEGTMRPVEVSQVVGGEVRSEALPAIGGGGEVGNVPGPDVIVGDLNGLAQFNGATGTQVGLAVGTDSCNSGVVDLNWFALPSNDHPVIPQNLYRMSGGPSNNERFEQIGQSNVKHAFTALTENICSLGCNGVGNTHLGSGCSDPYVASLNAGPNLGSRAWINPFTGAFPRSDGGNATHPNLHTSHSHTGAAGAAHKILTEIADLNTSLNPGATYYAEAQYVTPHEFAWCQTHPGECNMNNNVSYRRYSVTGTGSPFSFTPVGATVRQQPAIAAWPGATIVQVRPDSAADGVAMVAYKVTNPSAGVWHYEYAIYNQNLDRGIQSFAIPKHSDVTLSNLGFHAPPQQPGWTFDGTAGNTGYSSTPWAQQVSGGVATWSSETLAQNPNANAVRWGTMYNIRFDANTPPMKATATIGFYKTGAPVGVTVEVPSTASATCGRNGPC